MAILNKQIKNISLNLEQITKNVEDLIKSHLMLKWIVSITILLFIFSLIQF